MLGIVLAFSPRKFCELSGCSLSVGVSPIGTDKITGGRIVNHPGVWIKPNQIWIQPFTSWPLELRKYVHSCVELISRYCIMSYKLHKITFKYSSNFTNEHHNKSSEPVALSFSNSCQIDRKRLCIFITTSIYDHIIKRRQAGVFATFNTSKRRTPFTSHGPEKQTKTPTKRCAPDSISKHKQRSSTQ